LKQVF